MSDRQLVITADDFGMDPAVNAAVEIAHRDGVLTAASLMVGAPATDDAVALAKASPKLRVGLHLVLTDGWPVLPPETIPHLVASDGSFRNDMARLGADIFFSPAARRELAMEIESQFARFAATGLTLDHANAHKHFHVHPTIAHLMARIGSRFGLRAVRIPVEPAAALAKIEPGSSTASEWLANQWGYWAASIFHRLGITTPDQVFGLRWTGRMTTERLARLLHVLPSGLSEVYLHPATEEGFFGSAAGYDYRGELAALVADEVKGAAQGLCSGGFQDFVCP
jgi:hopanoid biosynthesis associated protein HpnK